ncbi:MAG: tripartite tricarboxylate transporter substrate-binding protein [Comamonadaceae bacterium]|nr:tripartite tricarboxylate transporter substrate-binding protein [Comamonadaceae bacterium]
MFSLAAVFAAGAGIAAAWEPTKQVEFVVPAGTGGGADQMARFIQGVVAKHNLMKQPMVVVNKGGGAGAEGFLDVKDAKGDPHKIIITLSNLFTTPLATGVPFNWKDMTPVSMLALDQFVLWVNAESPYKTAKDYIDAVKAGRPEQACKMGGTGSQAGRPDHHRRDREGRPARSSSTCPFKGGGDVAVQLVGKHVDSTRQQPDRGRGALARRQAAPAVRVRRRAHALQGQGHRHACRWNDIPTCKEAGRRRRLPDAARHLHAAGRDARAGRRTTSTC